MPGRSKRQSRIRESKVAYRARQKMGVRATAKEVPFALEDWEWVQQEYARLSEEYAGRWIAVSGRRVVGASPRLATAVRQARKAGVEHPFVTAFKAAKYRRTLEVAHWL